ncbi:MAG: leucine-rich repeat domain-containing protein [Pseudoflavonifractor sp.]|nr:leucine-rich repeat domain-containing protein [Pseudoflavonifractor sp.]
MRKFYVLIALAMSWYAANASSGDRIAFEGLVLEESDLGYVVVKDDSYQSLTSVTIPGLGPDSRPIIIGDYAFSSCELLTNVVIGEGVVHVGDCAFQSCDNLKEVTIPSTVSYIGFWAFPVNYEAGNLPRVQTINITSLEGWCDINFANEYANPGGALVLNGELLTDVHLPWIQEIKDYCFRYNGANFRTIEIPYTITAIGAEAFKGCGSSYYDEDSPGISIDLSFVCRIGARAFEESRIEGGIDLTNVIISDAGLPFDATQAFRDCPKITSVILPREMMTYPAGMFTGCTSLKSLEVPDGNRFYRSYDGCLYWYFYGQHYLIEVPAGKESIKFPEEKFTMIGYEAFRGSRIKDLKIPGGVEIIEDNAFTYSDLNSCTIPSTVEVLGNYLFYGSSIRTVIFEPGNTLDCGLALSGINFTPAYETVYLGRQLVPEPNFGGWLSSLYLHSLSEWSGRIDSNKLYRSQKIYIDGTLPVITGNLSSDICSSVSIFVEDGLYEECIADEKWSQFKHIFRWTPGERDGGLPIVRTVTDGTLDYNILSIEDKTAELCKQDENLRIEGDILSIPETVEGYQAVYQVVRIDEEIVDMSGVKEIKIPSSVRFIANKAFYSQFNNQLSDVWVDATEPPTICSSTFYNPAKTTLHVPSGSLEAYKNDRYWKKFGNIIENTQSAVSEVLDDQKDICVTTTDGGIRVDGMPDGQTVKVYTPSGTMVYSGMSGHVHGLAAGVYIVRVGDGLTVKTVVR